MAQSVIQRGPNLLPPASSNHMLQSKEDLEIALARQLRFLQKSANDFDNGDLDEAIRMAATLRVLLHDGKGNSRSLISQLNLREKAFISTVEPYEPNPLIIIPYWGLIKINFTPSGTTAMAVLDDAGVSRSLIFTDWWAETVFVDEEQNSFTREGLILLVTDKDGGAHVDPKLPEPYANLSRNNSLGVLFGNGHKWIPLKHPEWIAIRQIAHEVLKSLVEGYTKRISMPMGLVIGGIQIEGEAIDSTQPSVASQVKKKGRRWWSKSKPPTLT